jgi:hypothetical protein
MKRYGLIWSCLFFVVLGCQQISVPLVDSTTSAKSASSSPIEASYFGLGVHNSTVVPVLQYGTARSWDANPGPDWADSNPSPGVYNFAGLDAFISANQANGTNPGRDMIYTLGRTPQWASSQPDAPSAYGPGQCAPPADFRDWDNYLTAVVTHANGAIKYWELWNEPMNPLYYCGNISTMVTLAQHAQTIIKKLDPSAVILSPATGTEGGPAWLSSFLAQGGAAAVDVIAFHGYWSQTAEDIVTEVQDYKTIMADNGVSDLPLWDTEGSGELMPTMEADADFLSKYYLLQASLGVSRFLWDGYDSTPQKGQLWTPTYGLNEAGTAFDQTYKWMVGATLTDPCAVNADGLWKCGFSRSNYQGIAMWNSTATSTVSVLSQFVQYRDLLGVVHPITSGTVSVGTDPIFVETAPALSNTLSFAPIGPQTLGASAFPIFATSVSNGAITYSVVSGPATLSGSNVLTTGTGVVVLEASQTASGDYLAATATTRFNVSPLAPPLDSGTSATSTSKSNVASGTPSTAIQSTYFGLTVFNSESVPLLQSGISRSWDTWPHPDWSDSNPSEGVYDFTAVDAYIAGNSGRDMIYTLGRTPQWASSQPNAPTDYGPGECAPPTNISDWDNYLTALVTHAAGQIKYWELWNEPQNKKYYCGDIPTMVLLAQHANQIIKSIDPSAVILSPSPTSGTGPAWLSSFLSQGGAATVDVIAFHGYADQVAEDIAPIVHNYQAVMATNGLANLPMWDTEESGGDFPTGDDDAAFLSKIYLLQASQGVSRSLWFAYDAGDVNGGELWSPATGLTEAATAYAQTQNWMVGASLTTPCATSTAGVWSCGFSRTNYEAEALWDSGATAAVSVAAQFVQYRDLAGNIYPITNGTVNVGNEPILVETAANTTDTLTFAAITPPSFEGAPFPVFASSASNGAVTYSVVSGPATLSGSIVTLTGAGTVVLSASQAANANFVAGTASTSFYAAPGPPTLAFAPIATQTFGSAPFPVSIVSNSIGAVTYSVVSGPATVSGSVVTLTGAGTVAMSATLAANGNYSAATTSTSFTVTAGTPPLAFVPLATQTYGARFSVTSTSPSDGQVFYSVISGPATISGYLVNPTGVGTVVLGASQRATANYLAATATTSVTIAPMVPSLYFVPIATQTYGNVPFTVSATSVSSGQITYGVASGPATVAGSTVTLTGAGTVILNATEAANGNYSTAVTTTSFTVSPGACPLSFTPIASQTYGTRFSVSASSSSTGQIFYSVVSGPATISGALVTPTSIGTVVVGASQRATGSCAAGTATASASIVAMVPNLSFLAIPSQTYGSAPFTVGATSVSGGAISYSVASGPAMVSGSTVTLTGVGTVILNATVAANGNYTTASTTTSFAVSPGSCPLSFTPISSQTYGTRFSVSATSSSTGQVFYSVVSGPATISGYLVSPTGVGTVVLGATQRAAGNCAAGSTTTSATIAAMVPQLTFTRIPTQAYGTAPFTVNATSVSGGQITYSVLSGPATINGSTVTLTGLGTVMLGANQAANGDYAVSTTTTSFSVTNGN